MSTFPETSLTLLSKLAAQVTGQDDANWTRFWHLYAAAIRTFAVRIGGEERADDAVQQVLMKLVNVFRGNRFRSEAGSFRAYLAQMVRNELGMMYRKEKARGGGKVISLEAGLDDDDANSAGLLRRAEAEMAVGDETVWQKMDLEWAKARHASAVAHVLERTAMSKTNKDIYRAFVLEERPIDEVAKRFGVPRNQVSVVKHRVDAAVAFLEAEMGEGA